MTPTDPTAARAQFAASPWRGRYARHGSPAFVRLLDAWGYGRVFTRAEGAWIEDESGRRYLDALAGFGSYSLGHYPPRLSARIAAALQAQPLNLCHIGIQPEAVRLAERLAGLLPPLERVMFSNSGSEAVEAAVKLARAATGRAGILYAEGSFHGTGLGSLSLIDSKRWQRLFQPLLPQCRAVPFGDLAALEKLLRKRDIALLVLEPIQAEGGIRLPPPGYLAAAAELCARHGTLLALDEVQTGLGRTGRWFACQHEGVVPDLLILAKALGAGLVSIAATLARTELHDRAYGSTSRFDLHSSTYGGNALAAVVADENLAVMAEDDLPAQADRRGAALLHKLREGLRGHPLVADIRGRGLLIGIELGAAGQGVGQRLWPGAYRRFGHMLGQWLALQLLEDGVICQPCSRAWNVLRLEPPLTIDEADLQTLADTVVRQLWRWSEPLAAGRAMLARRLEQGRLPR